jgi:tyrosyl-tRNA synthetase
LLGRQFQREFGQLPQICATVPLLIGLDGEKKMSKSLNNYVGITEDAPTQFGKLMSMSDELMPTYARLAAFWSQPQADALANAVSPIDAKKGLAEAIVARYHGDSSAAAARDYFERTVQRKEIPLDNIPEVQLGDAKRVVDVLVRAGFAAGRREAERLISGNGVKVDGIVVDDPRAAWTPSGPAVLSVGSRRFARIVP